MKKILPQLYIFSLLLFSLAAVAQPTVVNVISTTVDGTFKIGDAIDVRITFSAAVNVAGTPQLELETGTTDRLVNYASGSGTTVLVFTNYVVQAGDVSSDLNYTSTTALSLNGGTIKATSDGTTDAILTLPGLGTAQAYAGTNAFVIDGIVPTVSTVSSSTANGSYKATNVVAVTIQFSEIVNVVGTPQITLETGATDRTINYSSGTGSNTLTFNYTVQANDVSSDLDYVAVNSLALNGGTIRDVAGNNATLTLASPGATGSLADSKDIIIDTQVPTVLSISSTKANGTYKAGEVIDINVLFSEPVNVTGTPRIQLETGATDRQVNYSSGSGTNTLTFNYTIQAGDVSSDLDYLANNSLALNGGDIEDVATNDATLTLAAPGAANSLGNAKALVVDTQVPTVSSVTSTKTNGAYKEGEVIDIRIVFSEVVNVTGTPQITLETGSTDQVIDYSSGSGSNTLIFNYTIQAGDASSDLDYKATNSLVLNGGTIADASTNDATLTLASPGAANSLGNAKALVVDTEVPTVNSVSSATSNGTKIVGDVIAIAIQFSEVVTVTGTPQLTLETGTTDRIVNYSSGTGSNTLTFNYTVQTGDESSDLDYTGTTALALNGGTIRDAANNDATLTLASPGAANSLGSNENFVVDGVVPTVVNVTSSTADGAYKQGDIIAVTVEFSEAVTVTGTPRITLETGATDRNVNYSSGTGTTTLTFNYTVQANDVSSDLDYTGIAALALNGGTIRDASTNNATLTLAAPGAAGSLGANKAIIIDTAVPTVSSVTSNKANGAYKAGEVIDIRVVFSEAVNVTGTPRIQLETGATDRQVNYSSGTGTNTLIFNYTVQAGDVSNDLDYLANNSLNLNGGTIRDDALNSATLTLANPGAANSLGNNKALVIDTSTPTVSGVTSSASNGTYNLGDVLAITVQFSETVLVTGTPQLTLETGTTDRVVDYSSGSNSNTLTFNYTVQAGDVASDLDYTGTSALALNGGTIQDAATNSATLTLASPGASGSISQSKNLVIDGIVPTVANVTSSTANGSYNAGDVIAITIQFSETVTVTGTPQLTLETGATDRVVNYSSGSGGTTLTFNYTVQAGDVSADLDYTGTTSLALNGGSIRDAATNDADLTLATPGATNSLGFNKALVIDTQAPSVTIVRQTPNTSPTNATSVTFRVTFNETVTGVNAADFELNPTNIATGTIGVVNAVSGLIYDVPVTSVVGQTTDILNLDFAAAQNIVDVAGNAFAFNITSEEQYVVDNTKPSLSPDEMNLNPNGLGAEEITFTLSENITNLSLTGFTSSTGSVASATFTGGGTTNTVTLTNGGADGTWTAATTISYSTGTGNVVDLTGNTMNAITNHAVVQNIVNLSAGAIAFTSFKSDDPNRFSVVLLKDVSAGTTIKFTDNGWTASNTLRTSEQTFTWIADVDYFAGTEIIFTGTSSSGIPGTVTASTGITTPSGVGSELLISASSGDQILAYQGSSTSPTFLAAIQFNSGSWEADAIDNETSALPLGLTNGTNAIALGDIDNGAYNIPGGEITTGAYTALRNNINGSSNWDIDNDPANVLFPSAGLTNFILPPDLTGSPFSPANGSTIPATLPNLTITYNDNVTAGTSTGSDINLYDINVSTVVPVATWNVGTPSVTFSGATVTIVPGAIALVNNHVYRVEVAKRVFLNADGNGNTAITGTTWQFTADTVIPTVTSITRKTPSVASTFATSVVFAVTFSENVTGLAANDFSANTTGFTGTIGSISVSASSGTTVDVTINTTIAGNGVLGLNVLTGNTITDGPGNLLASGTPTLTNETYTIDQVLPTVTSIVRKTPATALTNATSVVYTVTFSEDIDHTTFTDADLTKTLSGVTVGTATIVETNATSGIFDVTLPTVSGNGTIRLDIDATATINDVAGNDINTSFTTGEVYTLDQTAPTIASILRLTPTTSPTNATSVTFQITFSEDIDGSTLSLGELTLATSGITTGVVTVTQQADLKKFNVVIPSIAITTPGVNGTIDLDVLAAASILDPAGNDLVTSLTTGETYVIDQTAPTVSSIEISSPVKSFGTNGSSASNLDFLVTFSEDVQSVNATNNFSVVTANDVSGLDAYPGITVSSRNAPSTTTANALTVNLTGLAGTGWVRINFIDNDVVTDAAGNPVGGVGTIGLGNGSFTTSFTFPGTPGTGEAYTRVLAEPSNPVSSFQFNSAYPTYMYVEWQAAVAPATQATHYLIILKEQSASFPLVTDGTYFNNDPSDLSDGILVLNQTHVNGFNTALFQNLNSGTAYDFIIYPYTLSANNGNTNIDYYTNSPLQTTGSTTTVASATISSPASAATISSLVDTQVEASNNFRFTVTDEPALAPDDNAPFKFSGLTIFQGSGNDIADWSQAIAGAELTDGASLVVAASNITATEIQFTSIPSGTVGDLGFIPDGALGQTYYLKIWLKSSLGGTLPSSIDNLNFVFLVNNSSFSLNNTSNAQASTTLQASQSVQSVATSNQVTVVASRLNVETQPQTSIGVGSNFPVGGRAIISATDNNGNRDLNYTTANGNSASVTNTSALSQSASSFNFTSGLATLTPLNLTAAGTTKFTIAGTGTPSVSTVQTDDVTAVISSLSQITASATFDETSNTIASTVNVQADAVTVFDFTITDDAGANLITFADNDALPTLISQIIIQQVTGNDPVLSNWTHAIGGALLTDGITSVLGTVASNSITFAPISTGVGTLGRILDGGSKTYQVKIWLKSSVDASIKDLIDNKDFVFSVSSGAPDVTTVSVPANSSSTLQASSTTSGDGNNTVDVDATHLVFTTQPSSDESYDADFSVSPIVKAQDTNGNLDQNYMATPTVVAYDNSTKSIVYSTANTGLNTANGIVSFNTSFQVTSVAPPGAEGDKVALVVSEGSLQDAISDPVIMHYSASSDVIHDASITNNYSENILYKDIQFTDITSTDGIEVDRFIIRDNSGTVDPDGSATKVQSITFSVTGYQNIRRLAIYDGTTELAELDNADFVGNTITFTLNGILIAPDDGAKTFSLRASFLADVTDNDILSFTITMIQAVGTGSVFATNTPIGISSTVSGDENKIEVVATKLVFNNPSSASNATLDVAFNPGGSTVKFDAWDVNNNHDSDFIGTITAFTTAVPTTNGPVLNSSAFSAGSFTFSNLYEYDQEGDGTISLTAGSISSVSPPAITVQAAAESKIDLAVAASAFIPYKDFQDATLNATNTSNSFELARFTLFDGNGTNDADGSETTLNALSISLSNPSNIRQIALYDGVNKVSGTEQSNPGAGVNWSGLNLIAADNASKTFSVRASFNTTVTADNDVLSVTITSATSAVGSSRFAMANAGGATTGTTANKVQVITTQLVFTTQPPATNNYLYTNLATSPVVRAYDINNNLDTDYTSTVTISNSTDKFLPLSISSMSMVNGVLTFPLAFQYQDDATHFPPATGSANGELTATASALAANSVVPNSGTSTTNPDVIYASSTTLVAGLLPEATQISSLVNTAAAQVPIFDFKIVEDDAAAGANNDGSPTRITSITITRGGTNDNVNFADWRNIIAGASLIDDAGNAAVIGTINASSITFNSLNTSTVGFIADNGSKTYTLSIHLLQTLSSSLQDVVDNKVLSFKIEKDDIQLASQSSTIAPGETEESGSLSIEVDATQFTFTTQPAADQSYDALVTPSPIIEAQDANGNVDLDYAGSPVLTVLNTINNAIVYSTTNPALTNTNGVITFDSGFRITSTSLGADDDVVVLNVTDNTISKQSNVITMHYSGTSDIIHNNAFVYTDDILYKDFQTNDIQNNTSESVVLDEFILRDGGASSPDADGSDTKLTSITLNVANYDNIRNLALYNGNTWLAELDSTHFSSITPGNITFSGFIFTATDNASNTLRIRASFTEKVTDNEVITFTIVSVGVAAVNSSQLLTETPAGIVSNAALNNNKIEVVTTQLDFTTQPAANNISTYTNIDNPYMVVSARDVNANLDLDYVGTLGSISNTCTGCAVGASLDMQNEPTGNFVAGVYNFLTAAPTFQFIEDTGAGTVIITLPVTAGSLNQLGVKPTDAISSAFKVAASFESQIKPDNTYSLANDIEYIKYQTGNIQSSDIDSGTGSYELVRLLLSDGDADVVDGGAAGDVDGASTSITDLTLRITNHEHIRKIALYNNGASGATELKELDASNFNGSGQITFSGLNIEALDDNTTPISVRISFNSDSTKIIDGSLLQVTVLGATLGGGSKFYDNNSNDGLTYITGVVGGFVAPADKNIVNVIATRLNFTTQPADFAGINQPLSIEPVVKAFDANIVRDLDFENDATITAPVTLAPYTLSFKNGVLNFTGIQYTAAGEGKFRVQANGLDSDSGLLGSIPSEEVDVIHVRATLNETGVVSSFNLKGGTTNAVIFGTTFTAEHQSANDPKLQKFSIVFDKPYKTSSSTILKNFRFFESTSEKYDGATNVSSVGALIKQVQSPTIANDPQVPDATLDMVTVIFPTPRAFKNNNNQPQTLTYYMVADVDATANNSTESLTPMLVDRGFVSSATDTLIRITQGSATADSIRRKVNGQVKPYTFASTKPPTLVSSYPKNGQLNVDSLLSTITLTFDVPVWSLDGKVELYDRYSDQLVGTLNAITGNYVTNQLVAGSVDNPTPLTFQIPNTIKLIPDSLYYIKIKKGTFTPGLNSTKGVGEGISDDGFNLYGGIDFNGGLYFKIASKKPPIMTASDNEKYYLTSTGGAINASFDQFGKAYFLITDGTNATAPTTAQIKSGGIGYASAVGNGSIDIKQVLQPQFGSFSGSFTPGATYDVWLYAQNDAIPNPVATPQPFGSRSNNFAVGTTGPTFTIKIPVAIPDIYLNKPVYQICANSNTQLADPIVIAEGVANDFNLGQQSLNILLPTGFQFVVDSLPNITLIGSDFDSTDPNNIGLLSYSFLNNTILKVSYNISSTSSLDQLIIGDLYVVANASDLTGDIIRFAGNAIPDLVDGEPLATIVSSTATPFNFTNSYTIQNSSEFALLGITNAVTYIPDNFIDTVAKASTTRLIPKLAKKDYGPSYFTGSGVTNDVLSLTGVTLNTAFNITMTHTDMNGCVSNEVAQYTVYDHTKAIEILGTKECVVNTNFLTGGDADPLPSAATVFANARAGFTLLSLTTSIPSKAKPFYEVEDVSNNQVNTLNSQIIYGPLWQSFVEQLPQPFGNTGDYKWDYSKLLNVSSSSALKNPYLYFDETTPQGRTYYKGGSLGLVEFTGKYQSTSDADVLVPLRQEVEIFVPAIPVVEVNTSNQTATEGTVNIFCEFGGDININGYPAASSGSSIGEFKLFQSNGTTEIVYDADAFVDNGNGTATLKPYFLEGAMNVGITNGYSDIVIQYIYNDINSPCKSTGTITIRITPNPVANFTITSLVDANVLNNQSFCEAKPLTFVSTSTIASTGVTITENNWSFNDVNANEGEGNPNTASGLTAAHFYKASNEYTINLEAVSEFGCKSNPTASTAFRMIEVGAIPIVDFTFVGVSTTDIIQFTNTSQITSSANVTDGFANTTWNYGDGSVNGTTFNGSHQYTTAGRDTTTVQVVSTLGCVNTLRKGLVILPSEAPTASDTYVGNFNADDGEWQTLPTKNSTIASSWDAGTVNKGTIKTSSAANGAWVTNLTGSYNSKERSALYSPAFNLSGLDRPIVTFNSFVHLDNSDGVVLQYSTDNLNIADPNKVWTVLGPSTTATTSGVNWLTDQSIASKPGDQVTGDFGWTGLDTEWRESKHKLTDVKGATRVVFRFALASAKDNPDKDGFAMDDFRIGNGTRTVLLENFTNTASTDPEVKIQNDSVRNFQDNSIGVEVVKVNYHVGFPGADPFNALNPDDPGSRALYYGISTIPAARLDGAFKTSPGPLFRQWGENTFNSRVLDLSNADITISIDDTNPEADSIVIDFTPAREMTNTVLHVLVVEEEVLTANNTDLGTIATGETTFDYVLRKMLPNASGTKYSFLAADIDNRVALPWGEGSNFNPSNDMAIIAFLQDEMTKTVYQSTIKRSLADPKVITAVEQPADKSFDVYPNPADQQMTVKLPHVATRLNTLMMYDQMGKVVSEMTFEKGEQIKHISTDRLASGIYIMKIDTPQGMLMKKVMISHRQ